MIRHRHPTSRLNRTRPSRLNHTTHISICDAGRRACQRDLAVSEVWRWGGRIECSQRLTDGGRGCSIPRTSTLVRIMFAQLSIRYQQEGHTYLRYLRVASASGSSLHWDSRYSLQSAVRGFGQHPRSTEPLQHRMQQRSCAHGREWPCSTQRYAWMLEFRESSGACVHVMIGPHQGQTPQRKLKFVIKSIASRGRDAGDAATRPETACLSMHHETHASTHVFFSAFCTTPASTENASATSSVESSRTVRRIAGNGCGSDKRWTRLVVLGVRHCRARATGIP